MELFELLAKTLRDQAIPEDKVLCVMQTLQQALPNENGDHIWQSFCKGCLEVGIDPHAVMASALGESGSVIFENSDLESC